MADVRTIEQQLQQAARGKSLPPVDRWTPALSGDIDIRIDREGRWYHEGVQISREPLVRLFASILWREGDDYFLVTPVEKWRIQVDLAPLLVVAAQIEDQGPAQKILLRSSTGDVFCLDHEHPLTVDHDEQGQPLPLVRVRYQLDALLNRAVFYQLADIAVQAGDQLWGVWSCGEFFPLSGDL